jgi:hypothetical protein
LFRRLGVAVRVIWRRQYQTRSGEGNIRPLTTNLRIPRRINSISVEPIADWIGTQLEGQSIPSTIQAQLKGDHPGFPEGLLVLQTSDKNTPRILVPKHVQHSLVTQAHLDIHHHHYRKVHKLLRPIYYWPSMDDDIASICKRCTICQLAKVRRQKLQTDFDSLSPQATYKPRQHYGIDFYGLQGAERDLGNGRSIHKRNSHGMATIKKTEFSCADRHATNHI